MRSRPAWSGETTTTHTHTWAFPTGRCASCDSKQYDPDRLYCEMCTHAAGIAIAEEAGEL